jgi:hypothetical protein
MSGLNFKKRFLEILVAFWGKTLPTVIWRRLSSASQLPLANQFSGVILVSLPLGMRLGNYIFLQGTNGMCCKMPWFISDSNCSPTAGSLALCAESLSFPISRHCSKCNDPSQNIQGCQGSSFNLKHFCQAACCWRTSKGKSLLKKLQATGQKWVFPI